MSEERPKRPILSLKPGARTSLPDFPTPPPALWKCKPCGTTVEVVYNATGDVRCPSCNARLGKAEDFLAKPPNQAKVRARPAPKKAPAKPAPRPRRL
jgi:hypothetical protein